MSAPAKYRTREEVQKMREQSDGIEDRAQASAGGLRRAEADLKVIDDEVKAIVQYSADFAQTSPDRMRRSSTPTSCLEKAP
jgi:pyruvate dehydrogenase E1 component alpha subunit